MLIRKNEVIFMNFEKAQEEMIRHQIKGRGIRDKRVLSAMSSIPREKFVLEGEENNAYLDCPLPIGMGQTISQPFMVALMTQCLSLKGSETVLEVGTGSGYQAAILSKLAKMVYTIERFSALTDTASITIYKYTISNNSAFLIPVCFFSRSHIFIKRKNFLWFY